VIAVCCSTLGIYDFPWAANQKEWITFFELGVKQLQDASVCKLYAAFRLSSGCWKTHQLWIDCKEHQQDEERNDIFFNFNSALSDSFFRIISIAAINGSPVPASRIWPEAIGYTNYGL
jgi:hypothetical protein